MSTLGTTYASAPFDDPLADLIIRSADGIDFRVFKIDLIRSSPVFKDMLSIPQPQVPEDQRDELPVVSLSESKDTLQLFLRFCTIGINPPLLTFEDVSKALETSRKYDVSAARSIAQAALTTLAPQDPVRAYALACHYKLERSARSAAFLSLRRPLLALLDAAPPELAQISGMVLQRLIRYRRECSKAAIKALDGWLAIKGEYTWVGCRSCNPTIPVINGSGKEVQISSWWYWYIAGLSVKFEDCAWEGVIVDRDALEQFVRRSGHKECQHDNLCGDLDLFMPKLRTKIAESIKKIKLEYSCE